MKHFIAALLVFVPLVAPGATASKFSITAKKDTVSSRKSDTQQVPGGSTRLNVSDVRYVFTVRKAAIQTPADIRAEWMVLVEDKSGRLRVGTRGRKDLDFSTAREVKVETETVRLTEREWRGKFKQDSVDDSIYGYGIRILDAGDSVVGEKYTSSKVQKEIEQQEKKLNERKGPTEGGAPAKLPRRRLFRR